MIRKVQVLVKNIFLILHTNLILVNLEEVEKLFQDKFGVDSNNDDVGNMIEEQLVQGKFFYRGFIENVMKLMFDSFEDTNK